MPHTLDRDKPLPRYYQVYSSLLERIRSGEFGADKAIPPERHLTKEYGVSRITIVKAMDRLKHEGFIDRQHGRGTFVRSTKLVLDPDAHLGFDEQLQKAGAVLPDWKVLDRGYFKTPEKVAKWLDIGENSLHFQVCALLNVNGQPVGYHHIGVRRELAIRSEAELLDDPQLMAYVLGLSRKHNCQCQRGFEAVAAGEEEARWLDVPPGSPLLMVELLYTDPAGKIAQFIRSYFRGDRFRYNT